MSERNQKFILLAVGVLVMSILISYLVFAWTEPSQNPPGGNVPPPLYSTSTDLNLAGPTWSERNVTNVNMLVGYNDLHLRSDSGNNASIFLEDSPKYIGFYTGGTERMRIDANGNVGIGTTSPSYKLHVQGGDIYSSGYVRGGTGLCIGSDCKTLWPSGFTHFQVFDTPGTSTFTVPPGVTTIKVEVWGGGGGGFHGDKGWGVSFYGCGGGGGGGGYGMGIFSVAPGTEYTIVVGKGGRGAYLDCTPVSCNLVSATNGGASSFGDLIIADGGGRAVGSSGGEGGCATAPISVCGGSGERGLFSSDDCIPSGRGGDGGGWGGSGGVPGDHGKGGNGKAPGGGGGGGCCNYGASSPGGDGAPGRVIVWW